MTTPRILATDLDGTLFPIDNDPDHRAAMLNTQPKHPGIAAEITVHNGAIV